MSIGGVMKLIVGDGKQDRLLCGQDALSIRLEDVRSYRRSMGVEDETPTIADIERTHLLFTNATFKPFVQTTSEYKKEELLIIFH